MLFLFAKYLLNFLKNFLCEKNPIFNLRNSAIYKKLAYNYLKFYLE